MPTRRMLIFAALLFVASVSILAAVWFIRPPGATVSLRGSPIPTLGDGRPGGPDHPQSTTFPFSATRTAIARLTQYPFGTPTSPPPVPLEFETSPLPSSSPAVFLATSLAADLLTPSPTPNPLACLPEGVLSDRTGDFVMVSWIQDGISFVIDRQGAYQTVRLLGVDAPPIAARRLEELIDGQVVRLVADPDGPDADEQGRLLRYVLTLDEVLINDAMLRSGEGRLAESSRRHVCRSQFAAAESSAKAAAIGVWGVQAAQKAATQTRIPTPTGPLTPVALLLTSTPSGLQPTATGLHPTVPGQPTSTGATLTLQPSATLQFTPTGPTTTAQTPVAPSPSPTLGGGNPPTATQASPTPSGLGNPTGPVAITNILIQGSKSNGADEYIEIKNTGGSPMDLKDWSIYTDSMLDDLDTWEILDYYFDDTVLTGPFILQPGQYCRMYTDEIRPDSCAGLKFGRTTEVWRNDGACGSLWNANDEPVDEYCYGDYLQQ